MCPLIPYCWLIKQLNLWGTQEGCVKKKNITEYHQRGTLTWFYTFELIYCTFLKLYVS